LIARKATLLPARSRDPHGETSSESRAAATYTALRWAIIRCELEPGRRVTEGELAERFGVGKATVRVVLGRLASERLVQVLPREGYRIAPITLKQVQDLFGARLIVEPGVARLAAKRVTPAQIERLTALCAARYTPGDQASVEHFLRANAEFHITIAEATGNERLSTLVATLLDELERLLHFSYLLGDRNLETAAEHQAIVDALAAGDADGADQAVSDFLIADRHILLDVLIASPGLQQVNLAAG
jgi:DNA-binding GntR family transcriptional regulator